MKDDFDKSIDRTFNFVLIIGIIFSILIIAAIITAIYLAIKNWG